MKVAIIGLDGATFDLIMPLIQQGRLPVLKGLIENGARAKLLSTVPPLTAPAWVSAFTGTNPGKHGIFDWFTVERDGRIVNSTDIRSKTLWDLLNECGKKTIVVNVPMTYPPRRLDGAMVSGYIPPGEEDEYTYPSGLKRELVQAGFRIGGRRTYFLHLSNQVRELMDTSDGVYAASLYLIKKGAWDFLMVVFDAVDIAQHHYWKYLETTDARYDVEPDRGYDKVIPEVYEKMDSLLGKLIENFDEDTLVAIISDHGFGPVHTDISVNGFLMQLGLLKLRSSDPGSALEPLRSNIRRLALRVLEALGIDSLPHNSIAFRAARRLLRMSQDAYSADSVHSIYRAIDFERTKAFFPSGSGHYIRINVKGGDLKGSVETGEYERLRTRIIDELYALKDPRTGDQVIEKVYRREEVYRGSEASKGGDLLIQPRAGYEVQPLRELSEGPVLIPTHTHSGHRPDGILIMSGPHIRRGGSFDEVNIVDVAPTVLHAAGAFVPKDLDGRVLTEMFEPDFVASHRPMYSDRTTTSEGGGKPYSAQDEEQLMRRLKDLGYV
jgi:predicted AlkP superfamily phosphohydrolase/phosphomutase